MATRSNIAYKTPEGKIRSVYCHWDGYPEHNGEMLRRHYTDLAKVQALVELGSISSLGSELGEKQDFDDRSTQKDEWTLAYHRDRGEELVVSEYDDIPSWIDDMEEYAYLYTDNGWIVNDHGATRGGFPVFDYVETVIDPETVKKIFVED